MILRRKLLWIICITVFVGIPATVSVSPAFSRELIIGTGSDATRPGDYQPLGMWEPACLIYETLVNLDRDSRPIPCLARAWEVSADGTVYTFHLRENVRFHDGSPFNATAVKANFHGLGRVNWRSVYGAVRDVAVVDELTIRFTLKRPVPLFFIHLAGSGYGIVAPTAIRENTPRPAPGMMPGGAARMAFGKTMPPKGEMPKPAMGAGGKMSRKPGASGMPKAMMARMGGNQPVVAGAVGTGPYRWDAGAYQRAQAFSVTRNEAYWQGKPVFSRITWRVIPDPTARTIALETGEIHLTGQSPNASLIAENVTALKGNPAIRLARATNWGVRLILINHTRPPFDDPAVRRAIRHGIDYAAIQRVLQEMATVCPGPFGPDTPFTHPTLQLPAYDPDKARALLDNSGVMDMDGDGIREFRGKPLSVAFTSAKSGTMAVLVCECLKKIGIRASIRPREGGAIFAILKQMDFDMAVHPNIPSFYLGLYHAFHSRGVWSANFNLPALDALLDRQAAATDMASFRSLGLQAQEMIHGQHIILFAINESKLAAYDRRVGDFVFPREEWVGAVQDIWRIR